MSTSLSTLSSTDRIDPFPYSPPVYDKPTPDRTARDIKDERLMKLRVVPPTPATDSLILVNDEPIYRSSMDSVVAEYLPEGMDVKEALARCEDPSLGWSLQFWITLADPVDEHVFFACPATGQTSWTPPQGVFVVPRQPEGEWWELADTSRGNRSYFYNTMTKQTQWTRPGENQFVIPLGLIQNSASPDNGKRRSRHLSITSAQHLRANDPSSPLVRGRSGSDPVTPLTPTSGPRPPPPPRRSPPKIPDADEDQQTPKSMSRIVDKMDVTTSQSATHNDPLSPRSDHLSPVTPTTPRRFPRALSVVGEGEEATDTDTYLSMSESGNDADQSIMSMSEDSVRSEGTMRKTSWSPTKKFGGNGFEGEKRSNGGKFLGMLARQNRGNGGKDGQENVPPGLFAPPWLSKRNNSTSSFALGSAISINRLPDHPPPPLLPKQKAPNPIPVDNNIRSKRLSTGLHPLLPSAVSAQIQNFQREAFASQYFATRRAGLLWQKLPLERVLEWQKQPISAPLLNTSKTSAKEAVMCFKVVQRTMGERCRAVEGIKLSQRSTSMQELAGTDGISPKKAGQVGDKGILEEVRWMIQTCLTRMKLKDEVYCQVIKQVTKNPDNQAVILGFQLFCVLGNAFAPSNNFEPFVRSFLENQLDTSQNGIDTMARYCLSKIASIIAKGGRGRALTIGEIEHASDAAFFPSVYGESLNKVMRQQGGSHPNEHLPIILPFLADTILRLKGRNAEGIFRIPGDGDVVAEIKSRIDRGQYQSTGIQDPHAAASLFKLWLRELQEPLIPTEMYNDALASASSTHPEMPIIFVRKLPKYNRRVLLFVIGFLQLFCTEEVVAQTKMTPNNLALVLAPNILRTPSDSLVTVYTNSGFESRFVLLLLQHMQVNEVDKGYKPVYGGGVLT